jgi:crotonobetainyl-CoA:carnitine CoA-transferase CaiB-like acyl-CoA transferase
LAGLKVLELARVLAGPWAGQMLADLGAEVVKVERAGVGDDTRGWGPPFVEGADGGNLSAAYYHAANRGKRSIELDFETEQGRTVVRKLAARSDVLIENFKSGSLAKFGLDYQSLSKLNPRLIYCSVTGFGQDGPYATRAGYDLLIQGMGGVMDLTGEAEGEPSRVGIPVVDISTGNYATVGILAALAEREKTGRGAHVDMALLDTIVGMLANQAMSYLITNTAPHRIGNGHPVVVPYQVFPVADGHVIVAVGSDSQFAKFCTVLGEPKLAEDERYRTNSDRVRNRTTLVPYVSGLTLKFRRDDLIGKLEAVKVPAGPINTVADVFSDPQVIARGMRLDMPCPAAAAGRMPGVRTPIKINGMPMSSGRPSPRRGEHTAEILREIGEG